MSAPSSLGAWTLHLISKCVERGSRQSVLSKHRSYIVPVVTRSIKISPDLYSISVKQVVNRPYPRFLKMVTNARTFYFRTIFLAYGAPRFLKLLYRSSKLR